MNQLIMLAMAMLACLQPMVYAQRSGTTRGNSYIGCNTYTPALGSDTYYAQDSSTTYDNGLACSNACSARSGGSFSFFSVTNRTCICSQNFPTSNNYGSGNQGACASGSNEVYRLRTTFTQYQSYPCRALSSINLSFTTVNGNINSCYQQCKSFTYAVYLPAGSGVYRCACTNDAAGSGLNSNSQTCDNNVPRVYVHSAAAQASQLDRRRQLSSQRRQVPALCPVGSTACQILGAADSYECLDINTELESCGGCMYGQFDKVNGTKGVDCNSLGGRLGTYSCQRGQCVSIV